MDLNKLPGILKKFKLSDYETRALSAIVLTHDLTAKEVSQRSKIPMAKIYTVLDGLQQRGFISNTLERPQRYRAVNPKEMLETFMKHREYEVSKLRQELESYLPYLEQLYGGESSGFDQQAPAWFVKGNIAVWEQINRMISDSKKELRFIAGKSWRDTLQKTELAKTLIAKAKKGVKIKLIMPDSINIKASKKTSPVWKKAQSLKNVEIRTLPQSEIHLSMIIQDSMASGRSIKEPKTEKTRGGILITDKDIVQGDVAYFDKGLWATAKKLE